MDIEQICQPFYTSPLEQIRYILTLIVVWFFGAFVVWWWVTKVLNPMIGLWAQFGLLYLVTGDWRLARDLGN